MSDKEAAPVQVIEATSKKWKKVQLVGVLLMVVGAVSCGMVAGADGDSMIPMSLLSIGFIVLVVGRVGGWWGHG